jgi:alpha-methylacyl-CoA racemase
MIDGGAPWYDVYETADGKHVAVGALEQRFYDELLKRLGLDLTGLPDRHDRSQWPQLRARLRETFLQKTRDQWCEILEGHDACFAPVLSLGEAPAHQHNRTRKTFVEAEGVIQPAPAPRFSRTPGAIARGAPERGEGAATLLSEWGFDAAAIARFRTAGALILDRPAGA